MGNPGIVRRVVRRRAPQPEPHKLAIGVVGSSPLGAGVARTVSLRLKPYPSESAARHAIDERNSYGALVSGPKGETLIVVPAAGNGTALALTGVFTAVAVSTLRSGWRESNPRGQLGRLELYH